MGEKEKERDKERKRVRSTQRDREKMATDDYMSDEFLKLAQEIEEKGKSSSSRSLRKRSKPSPFPSSSTSTGDTSLTLSSLSSQPLSKKKVQELMEERTIEGMETAIQSTNKGFKLLQKFGYTEGKGGLGKNNSGIENPLKIVKRENNDRYFTLTSSVIFGPLSDSL